jgi:hypothetical protein
MSNKNKRKAEYFIDMRFVDKALTRLRDFVPAWWESVETHGGRVELIPAGMLTYGRDVLKPGQLIQGTAVHDITQYLGRFRIFKYPGTEGKERVVAELEHTPHRRFNLTENRISHYSTDYVMPKEEWMAHIVQSGDRLPVGKKKWVLTRYIKTHHPDNSGEIPYYFVDAIPHFNDLFVSMFPTISSRYWWQNGVFPAYPEGYVSETLTSEYPGFDKLLEYYTGLSIRYHGLSVLPTIKDVVKRSREILGLGAIWK